MISIRLFCIYFYIFYSCLSCVIAQCKNRCSGHGICNTLAQCTCFSGYESSDCSKRVCPSGPSYADVAYIEDGAHQSISCSGQGKCNTATGLCECYDGYSGRACELRDCPNNCNGHGICTSLRNAATYFDGWTFNRTSTYTLWDADVSMGCQCDPGWSGHDCSSQSCDRGVDPRVSGNPRETVTLVCVAGTGFSGRFKLRFLGKISKTYLYGTSTATEVAAALMNSGGYYSNTDALTYTPISVLIDGSSDPSKTVCDASATTYTSISFVRKAGDVPAVSFYSNKMTGAEIYFETTQYLNCNCTSSLCDGTFQFLYEGEMSPRIDISAQGSEIYSALSAMATFASSSITFANESLSAGVTAIQSSTQICQDSIDRNHTIVLKAPLGNLPILQLLTSAVNREDMGNVYTDNTTLVMSLHTNDGRDGGTGICNNVGKCDYSNGKCTCPYGWSSDPDFGPCGQPTFNSSDWAGLGRCPGVISRTTGADWSAWRNPEKIYLSFNPTWARDSVEGQSSTIQMMDWTSDGRVPEMVYWDHSSKYPRVDRSSKLIIFNMTTNSSAGPLVLDRAADYLYFVDNNEAAPFIGRILLDVNGTAVTDESWLVVTGRIFGFAMDAHFNRRKLYWSVPGDGFGANGKIYWEYLDATTPANNDLTPTIGQDYLLEPMGIAIHYKEKRLYWVDNDVSRGYQITVLRSCDLDGTNRLQRFLYRNIDNVTMPANATDITINLRNNTMYFIDNSEPQGIVVTNLDLPNYLDVVEEEDRDYYNVSVLLETTWVNLSEPTYLFIDDTRDVLLWTDPALFSIKWMDMTQNSLGNRTSGTVYNFEEDFEYRIYHTDENFLWTEEYGRPLGIVLDKGMDQPKWGNYLDCYGNGRCTGLTGNWKCECYPGFYGDCRMRTCPTGPAWFAEPVVDNIAHDVEVECSNAGRCNRDTGTCTCDTGYEGAACERSTCSPAGNPCNGNGRCLSMKELAAKRTKANGDAFPITYGSKNHKPETWDATMRYGCYADDYGYVDSYHMIPTYIGDTLSDLQCPYGYDTRAETPALEIQSISCSASGGYFTLSFRGETTYKLYPNNTAGELEVALESLSTIGNVTTNASTANTGDGVCDDAGNVVEVSFNTELGDIPILSIVENTLTGASPSLVVTQRQASSGTLLECAGRGECDRTTGECICWDYRTSSDGLGNQGTRRDCGFNLVF